MKLRYLKSWAVTELRHIAERTPYRYESSTPWLSEVFADREAVADSRIEIDDLPDLHMPTSETELYEYENTVLLHSALSNLNRSLAADERLWSWLAHDRYWEYMRQRWPVESAGDKTSYILEHYFLRDSRGLVRHGLARLWWFGSATYLPGASDPYALTKLLLKTTDARQQIMERQFWRNESILHPFLRRIQYWQEQGLNLYAPRDRFRSLCKLMNLTGGSMVLDCFDADAIASVVDRYVASTTV